MFLLHLKQNYEKVHMLTILSPPPPPLLFYQLLLYLPSSLSLPSFPFPLLAPPLSSPPPSPPFPFLPSPLSLPSLPALPPPLLLSLLRCPEAKAHYRGSRRGRLLLSPLMGPCVRSCDLSEDRLVGVNGLPLLRPRLAALLSASLSFSMRDYCTSTSMFVVRCPRPLLGLSSPRHARRPPAPPPGKAAQMIARRGRILRARDPVPKGRRSSRRCRSFDRRTWGPSSGQAGSAGRLVGSNRL